jgi:hypothetical protein
MEACSGAHHIGRQIEALGHDVRLIPAQYVKPFRKGYKNDYRDAEAIAEAVQRPTMQFVRIKTPEQIDLPALHKVRSRLVRQRTELSWCSGCLIWQREDKNRVSSVGTRPTVPDTARRWPAIRGTAEVGERVQRRGVRASKQPISDSATRHLLQRSSAGLGFTLDRGRRP